MMKVPHAKSKLCRSRASSRRDSGEKSTMKRTLPTAAALRPAGARLIVVSLLALIGVFGARSSRAVALSVYGQLPSIENVALSPDGTRVAFVRTQGDLRVVFVANVADRKVIRYVKAGDTKLRDIEWADNNNLMMEKVTEKIDKLMVFGGLEGVLKDMVRIQVPGA